MQRFANINELKQASCFTVGANVEILGFQHEGDGGGFLAKIVDSELTPNEITIFDLGQDAVKAERIDKSQLRLSQIGVKYGSVSKQQQEINLNLLRLAISNFDEIVIERELEVYLKSGDEIIISNDVIVKGVGLNKSSISVFPKQKGIELGTRVLFNNFSNIEFSNIEFKGFNTRWSFETYSATIAPNGNQLAIRINDTVRTCFYDKLVTGQKAYVQLQDDLAGETRLVQSWIPAENKIYIDIPFETLSNFTTNHTLIGFAWEETVSESDVEQYGQQWNTVNEENLILFSSLSNRDLKRVTFNSCEIKGFDTGLELVATHCYLTTDKFKIQCNGIGISWAGAIEEELSRLELNNSIVNDCATLCTASINTQGVIKTNARYGGGVYHHPGIMIKAKGCFFIENNSTSVRNYSSSGNIIGNKFWRNSFINCVWYDNKEPLLITSTVYPTDIQGCTLESESDGGITRLVIGNSCNISDSIINVVVEQGMNADPLPNQYKISFDNCELGENFKLNANNWPIDRLDNSYTSIINCVWYLGNRNASFIKVKGGSYLLRDIELKNRNTSIPNFSDILQIEVVANTERLTIDLFNVKTLYDFNLSNLVQVVGDSALEDDRFKINITGCDLTGLDSLTDGKITIEERIFLSNLL